MQRLQKKFHHEDTKDTKKSKYFRHRDTEDTEKSGFVWPCGPKGHSLAVSLCVLCVLE